MTVLQDRKLFSVQFDEFEDVYEITQKNKHEDPALTEIAIDIPCIVMQSVDII